MQIYLNPLKYPIILSDNSRSPQHIYVSVIVTLECPNIRLIEYKSAPLKYKLVAQDFRAECEEINSHFSPVIYSPAWYSFIRLLIPHRRHMLLIVSLKVTSETFRSLMPYSRFSFNIRSTAGAAGISALILVFRETYISLPSTMLSSVNLYNPNVRRL